MPVEKHRSYDQFLEETKSTLVEMQIGRIETNRNVCGVPIDRLSIQTERSLGIDLVGYPGAYEEQLVTGDVKSLERAGIDIFLLPYSSWHFDKAACLVALKAFVHTSINRLYGCIAAD